MINSIKQKISIFRRKFKSQKKSYSLNGCDLLINYIFKTQNKGFYIDVGCQHPISNNNTYLLFKKGWNGINIDLDQKNIDLFNLQRPKDKNICACLSSNISVKNLYFFHSGSPINSLEKETTKNKNNFITKKVKTTTLNSVLSNFEINEIDYLNLDVEGHENDILQGFDINRYKPKVISVEYLDFKMEKMEFKNNNLHNVLKSNIYNFLIENGYYFINWTHADLIFVHKSFRD